MSTGVRFALWAAISGALAVLLAGLVALGALDRSLDSVVERRLEERVSTIGAAGSIRDACAIVGDGSAGPGTDSVAAVLDGDGSERCRSSASAPSPRSLGIDSTTSSGVRATVVDGSRWRTYTRVTSSGGRVLAAQQVEADERARADARTAILVAMVIGALVAAAGGAVAAVPARRRLALLLTRVRAAVRDRTGTTTVGRIGGRDLDGAASAVDELLAEVRSAELAQRRLVADAAHQLRTPITSVRTNAQLLERSDGLDPESRDMAERIARQSAAVAELVSGLVDYTAIGAWTGDRGTVELVEELGAVRDAARDRWPDLAVEVMGDESSGEVDVALLLRAIGNVVDNAVVHGGARSVRIVVENGTILVEDDGVGITLDERAAFQPFHSGGGGTGLGLAFVRHVARAHGGDAWIESRSPTTIAVRIVGSDR